MGANTSRRRGREVNGRFREPTADKPATSGALKDKQLQSPEFAMVLRLRFLVNRPRLSHVQIQAFLTAAVMNLKRLAASVTTTICPQDRLPGLSQGIQELFHCARRLLWHFSQILLTRQFHPATG